MNLQLEIAGLAFSYDAFRVLDGISYNLEKSSFTGLIGPNGSGKSTLLKNITRLLIPQQGEIELEGRKISKYKNRELARRVAVVPQSSEVSFDFTVKEIVLMGRSPHLGSFESEKEEDYQIANQVMKVTNTLEFADRSFLNLSGGEKQRVIIARALAQEPELLLLDEPTSHLDINYQLEIFELLKRLNLEDNLSIIVVSHDLNLAAQYCQELILLKDGKIYALGTPEQVITRENLKEVYNTNVLIRQNHSGRPVVHLHSLNNNQGTNEKQRLNLHLICGGGSGEELMDNLTAMGFNITAGVLNRGDVDWKVARHLGIKIIEEEPFAPISEEKYQQNLKLMRRADCILLAPVPFGHGNLVNLKALARMEEEGKNIYLLEAGDFSKIDYTGGKANEIITRLRAKEVKCFNHQQELIEDLKKGSS